MPNSAHEGENFADRWNDYPERRTAFLDWHGDLTNVLDGLIRLQGEGLPAVTSYLAKKFGEGPVELSARRYGDQLRLVRESGVLRMTTTGQLCTAS